MKSLKAILIDTKDVKNMVVGSDRKVEKLVIKRKYGPKFQRPIVQLTSSRK